MTIQYYRGVKVNKNSEVKKSNKEQNKHTYRGVEYNK
jgi:hypothetical protein